MPNYEPMSRESHLKRGHCCKMGCVYCPWRPKPIFKDNPDDLRIKAALLSGETVTIESSRKSLIPSVTLLGRVTINYQPITN